MFVSVQENVESFADLLVTDQLVKKSLSFFLFVLNFDFLKFSLIELLAC